MEDRYQGIALKGLLELEEKDELLLPNFQRAFEWERAKQHSLVASFVAGVPVGGILLLKGTGNDFAFKPLCYRSYETEMPEGECLYLLDGQQRISTLKSVFHDFFGDYDHWEAEMDRLWPQLQNRWFLKLTPNSEGEDPLGWELLRFDDQAIYHLPSEALAEHVVYKRILKNDSARREWFNPGFVRQELDHLGDNRNQIINALAERAAEDDLVPLYSALSEDEVPLHEVVIENVAEKRVRDLKAAVRDEKYSIEEVLGWLGGDVSRYEENGQDDLIEKEWQRLSNKWIRSIRGFVEAIVNHQVPRIQLENDETVRAISIFDNMNKGGTPLSTYDLVVARAALETPQEESLTDLIVSGLKESLEVPESLRRTLTGAPSAWCANWTDVLDNRGIPSKIFQDQYLNILSLLAHFDYGVFEKEASGQNGSRPEILQVDHIKQKKQLELTSQQIVQHSSTAVEALKRALCFLQLRCGIITFSKLHYKLLILPVAYVLHRDEAWTSAEVLNKIEYWYWSSLLGGAYREAQNPRVVSDLVELYQWTIGGGANPFESRSNRILNEPNYSDRELLLRRVEEDRTVPPAVEAGIVQYVLSKQPIDFLPTNRFPEKVRLSAWAVARGDEFEGADGNSYELRLQVHHVCPLASATEVGDTAKALRDKPGHILNSPLNFTPITERANKILGGKSEQDYIDYLSEMSLDTHLLPTESAFRRTGEESESERYLRLMETRYERLRSDLLNRLDLLAV